jgi:methylthioribose-1-phosphate isomerase
VTDPRPTEIAPAPTSEPATGVSSAPEGTSDVVAEVAQSGGADLARRRFFRQFATDVVQTAATAVGVVGALQRSSAEAASAILGTDAASIARLTGAPSVVDQQNPASGAPAGFRTAYRWDGELLYLVDQRRLPDQLVEEICRSAGDVAHAIREMIVRGAPAMGQVAAIGLALQARSASQMPPFMRRAHLQGSANALVAARPTAVNVRWAVDRCLAAIAAVDELNPDGTAVAEAVWREAEAIVAESAEAHERLALLGLAELPVPEGRPLQILTHCNTGPLACGQFGTALGVVQAAVHAGREIHVYVDETRPYLQGARLTAWELAQAGVPHTLIADSAAGWVLSTREVDAVLVGADRIAANGDTANKIGTYPLAVLAQRHGVPLYVCAPTSSIDLKTSSGADIQIEQRPPIEVTHVRGAVIAPPETAALNPTFDVTPADLITAIVTEQGVLRTPFGAALEGAIARATAIRPEALTAGHAEVAG